MTPNATIDPTGILIEKEYKLTDDNLRNPIKGPAKRKFIPIWQNIIILFYLHVAAVYGLYLALTSAKLATLAWAYIWYVFGGLGISGGVHRLWSHRSFKAKLPLSILLMIFNTIAFQNPILYWARDHRVHHKFSETEADPHNSNRGFFFSHVGWLIFRKQPEVLEKGKTLDVSDLLNDKVVMFQFKYYIPLMLFFCFILPTVIPVYFWNETWSNSWHTGTVLRHVVILNVTWFVASLAHLQSWGYHPYDKTMRPNESLSVSLLTLGEGWHNYHHVFPWDYKTSELGTYLNNPTTCFLDICAKLGLAYDLRTVSEDMVRKRVLRTGDGSHEIWGWGDKDQREDEKQEAIIVNPSKVD